MLKQLLIGLIVIVAVGGATGEEAKQPPAPDTATAKGKDATDGKGKTEKPRMREPREILGLKPDNNRDWLKMSVGKESKQ